MVVHDISVPLSEQLPVWPGDPLPVFERFSKLEEGQAANVSRMAMCVHFGTHVDAPWHFVQHGSKVDELALDVLTGPALVCEVPGDCDLITTRVLQELELPQGVRRVLFKTRNSHHWAHGDQSFDPRFVALAPDGAAFLVQAGVKLVGIDYLSIAPFHEPVATHKILLENKVIVLETIDLSGVAAGEYELVCLPLKLECAEGAPARAILFSRD